MELHQGICDLCNSERDVVNPFDTTDLWEKILLMFETEIDDLSDMKLTLKICSTCVFQITYINSKKDLLSKMEIGDDAELLTKESCKMCGCTETSCVFKIDNSKLSTIFSHDLRAKEKLSLYVCALCFYAVEANSNLRENLISRKCGVKKSSPGSLKCESKRYSTRKRNDELVNHQSYELEKENAVGTPKSTKKRLSRGVSDTEINSNIHKSHRKEVTSEVLLVSDEETTKDGQPYLSVDTEYIHTNSSSVIDTKPTNELKRVFRKRTAPISSESEVPSKRRKKTSQEIHNVNGFNMTKILQLKPLCETKLQIGETVRKDTKFYRSIPFVQLPVLKTDESPKSKDFKVKESMRRVVSLGVQESFTIRRTPPIKIKLKPIGRVVKPIGKIVKPKKTNNTKQENVKVASGSRPSLIEEMKKKKVVVNVARIILPKTEEDDVDETEDSTLHENNLDESPATKVRLSNLKDSSKEQTTPKKKKRVHFNDTPTIIVPEEGNMEDSYPYCADENVTTNEKLSVDDEVCEVIEESGNNKADSDIISVEPGTIELDDEDDTEAEEDVTCNDDSKIDSDNSEEKVTVGNHSVLNSEEIEEESSHSNSKEQSSLDSKLSSTVEDDASTGNLKSNADTINLSDLEEAATETVCSVSDTEDISSDSSEEVSMIKQEPPKKIVESDDHEKTDEKKGSPSKKNKSDRLTRSRKNDQEVVDLSDDESLMNENKESDFTEKKNEDIIEEEQSTEEENKKTGTMGGDKTVISDLEVIDSDEEMTEGDADQEESSSKENKGHVANSEDSKDSSKNNEEESEATNKVSLGDEVLGTEDFGSLIDEVQKCLTSNKDLPQESDDESMIELRISKEDEINDSLKSSDIDSNNVETEMSTPNEDVQEKTLSEENVPMVK